jgi:tellurite resistance protein
VSPSPLPDWPPGTVAILVTAGVSPHAIPVSALLRCDEHRVLIGLGDRRESLRRLRDDPRVTLVVVARAVAVSIDGSARVLPDDLVEGVVVVVVEVTGVQDHARASFELEAGVRWRWTDAAARDRDAEVRAALQRAAERLRADDAR